MDHPQNPNPNQNKNSLVLSSDAKPRLKWTPELHRIFIDAVTQLGGAEKATPKSLMRVMGIPGLTLYHLKSHLQKYRLGKSQQSEICDDNKQEVYNVNERRDALFGGEVDETTQNQINETLRIAESLQMQMEVQRKLHEQIEVQRHLQLRIEAQGKYLQSVLKKAHETLSGYNASAVGMELAKAELSQLVSIIDNGCQSPSLSVLTEIGGPTSVKHNNPTEGTKYSLESPLTSFESSGRKGDADKGGNSNSEFLPLLDLHPSSMENGGSSNLGSGRKRSGSTISDGNCAEKLVKTGDELREFEMVEKFDLNRQYVTESDFGPKRIDLD